MSIKIRINKIPKTFRKKIISLIFALCLFYCASNPLWADAVITSGPTVYSVSNTTATIVFDTNVPTYGKVEFGLDTNYGNEAANPFEIEPAIHHQISLPVPVPPPAPPNLLEPNTLYHFRVVATSTNPEEQPAVSADNIFQTEDAYFGTDLIKGQATGFYHLEKIDGRDWMITPEGKGFYFLGIGGVTSWMDPEVYQKKYFSNFQLFSEAAIHNTKKWNFNALGIYSYARESASRNKFPFGTLMEFINNTHMGREYPYSEEDPWRDYPDPWDTVFISSIDTEAERVAQKWKNDPYFIGYFVCDEPDVIVEDTTSAWNRWIRATIDRPAGQPGKEIYVNSLIEQYKTIEEFNKVYEANYQSFDEVRKATFFELYGGLKYPYNNEPGHPEQVKDLHAFNELLCERFFSTTYNALKSRDPNHLVLGHCLSSGFAEDEAIAASGKYTDVYSTNYYWYELYPNDIDRWSRLSKKPLLISAFSFLEQGHDKAWNQSYVSSDDQLDRAHDHETYVKTAVSYPNVIGVSWFAYIDHVQIDPYDIGKGFLNFGWKDHYDEEYYEFTDIAKDTNQGIYAYVLDNEPPVIEEITPPNQSFVKGLINVGIKVKDEGSGASHIEVYSEKILLASDYSDPYNAILDTTIYSDQAFVLTLKAYDKVGNVSIMDLTYTIDNTLPTPATPQIPEQNALLNDKNVNFSWLAGYDLNFDKYLFMLDGNQAAETTETSVTISDISDGLHTWSIITVDKAGNQTPSDELSFTVDDTDPVVVSTQPIDKAEDQAVDVPVSLNFSEKLDLLTVVSENFSVEGSVSGVHNTSPSAEIIEEKTVVNLNVQGLFKKGEIVTIKLLGGVKDLAGNYAQPYEFTFKTILPEEISLDGITIQDKSSGSTEYTNESAVILTAQNIKGNPLLIMISEDPNFTGAFWISFVNPTEFNLSSGDGSKTIYYKLKNADEIESNIVNSSIVLDTTSPTITILESPVNNSYLNNSTPTFKWTKVEELNFQKYQLFIDENLILETELNEITLSSPLSEGNHTWKVSALDKAENTSTSDVWSFTIDVTPPTLQITSPAEGSTVSGTVLLQATAEDPGSGVKIISAYIDGVLFGSDPKSPYQGYWDSINVPDGLHSIKAEAIDNAGNISTQEITVDVKNTFGSPPRIEEIKCSENILDGNKPKNFISAKPAFTIKTLNSKKITLELIGPSETYKFNSNQATLSTQSVNTQSWCENNGQTYLKIEFLEPLPPGDYKIIVTAENNDPDNIVTQTIENLTVVSGQSEIASGTLPLAYPNPFSPVKNSSVDLTYTLTANADVTLYIFNSNAQLIAKKLYSSGIQGGTAGFNRISWNGKTDFGETIGTGAYIIKIVSERKVIGTIKLAVIY